MSGGLGLEGGGNDLLALGCLEARKGVGGRATSCDALDLLRLCLLSSLCISSVSYFTVDLLVSFGVLSSLSLTLREREELVLFVMERRGGHLSATVFAAV